MNAVPPRSEPKPSQVTFKTAFTVCFSVVLVAAGVLFLLKTLLPLTLMLSAAMLAVALDHAVSFLERHRLKRPLAIALTIFVLLLLGSAFFLILVPPVVSQGKALAEQSPHILAEIQQGATFGGLERRFQVLEQLKALGSDAAGLAKGAVTPVLAALGGLLSAVGGLVTLAFLVIFMLVFGGDVVKAMTREITEDNRWRYERVLGKIYKSIGGYLGGLLLICSINATLTTTFLAIARVPFFLPLGILSGASSMIPYVGPIVVGASVSLIALVTGGVWKGLASMIYFILYGQLEGNILGPLIFRRTAHVNPLLTLLSILFLADLAGVVGAIIAVPAVAAAQIIIRELLSIRREQLPADALPPEPEAAK